MHGVLKTVIMIGNSQIELFNLHLDPKFEDLRVKEVKRLITLLKLQGPTLVVGDFNSLSQHDKYEPATIKRLKSRGITKFGYETLQYDVTNMLEARGLIDACAKLGKMSTSVPTPLSADKNHAVPLRLDYAFASPSTMQRIIDARVIKNAQTNAISDHYPLHLTLRG